VRFSFGFIDFAGSIVPDYPNYEVTVTLIPTDTNKPETVTM
jgi:hypothetical protein